MHWYKYMENRFAQSLVGKGALRINSLAYYRDVETHGTAVGDHEENTQHVYSLVENKTGDQLNEFERDIVSAGPNVTFRDCTFARTVNGVPTYALCLCESFSDEIMQRMSYENEAACNPSYDSCVCFPDHIAFYRAIAGAVRDFGLSYYGHGYCFYSERKIEFDQWNPNSQQCPAFIKPESYSWQREVRILFATEQREEYRPVDLVVPRLTSLCELK